MKNRKLVITLLAGAVLALTQAGYAGQEDVQSVPAQAQSTEQAFTTLPTGESCEQNFVTTGQLKADFQRLKMEADAILNEALQMGFLQKLRNMFSSSKQTADQQAAAQEKLTTLASLISKRAAEIEADYSQQPLTFSFEMLVKHEPIRVPEGAIFDIVIDKDTKAHDNGTRGFYVYDDYDLSHLSILYNEANEPEGAHLALVGNYYFVTEPNIGLDPEDTGKFRNNGRRIFRYKALRKGTAKLAASISVGFDYSTKVIIE